MIREIFRQLITDIVSSFRIMVDDLSAGRRFWIPVALGILPAILGAMTVSLNYPRLLVQLTVDDVTYVMADKSAMDRPTFARFLNDSIRDKISTQLDELFPTPSPTAGEEKGKIGPANRPGTATNQKQRPPERTPSAGESVAGKTGESSRTPVEANQGGGESVPESIEVFVKVPARIKVTNIGSLSSTLDELGMYIVEETDGRRDTWEQHIETALDIKIPQGQTVEVGGQQGKTVLFWASAGLFGYYETVRFIGEKLRKLKPKDKNRYSYAVPFLELLTEDQEDREQLLRIANPSVRSRLLLVVEVGDVYGRRGNAQVELMDSRGWMQDASGSAQK